MCVNNTHVFSSRGSFRFRRPELRLRSWIASLVVACCLAQAPFASAAIYMQIEGIAGEVTTSGYAGWIELYSLQWGVGRGITAPTGGASDREAAAPSFSEIVITKRTDKTTPLLFGEVVVGEGKKVTIHFVSTTSGGVRV